MRIAQSRSSRLNSLLIGAKQIPVATVLNHNEFASRKLRPLRRLFLILVIIRNIEIISVVAIIARRQLGKKKVKMG
jgi:hypothetical protein